MTRLCKKCLQEKPIEAFYNTYGYPRYTCKKCENRTRLVARVLKARKLKEKAVDYMGGKCSECGYAGHPAAFDFHHVGEKSYEPAKMFGKTLSWERIVAELKHCQLLCSNCHRSKHAIVYP